MKKLMIIAIFVAGISLCSAGILANGGAKEDPGYTNLKVLPKNISSKQLQTIMTDEFEDGLGVSCGFCHANAKNGRGLDFASDEKPEKEVARDMMRMTNAINKKYFKVKHPGIGDQGQVVSCTTCHKGEAFPDQFGANELSK